jgi:hypothetical protein
VNINRVSAGKREDVGDPNEETSESVKRTKKFYNNPGANIFGNTKKKKSV